MKPKLLIINFGSTSSKLSVFEGEEETIRASIDHPREELNRYPEINDQLPMRRKTVEDFLAEHHLALSNLTAIVGRAGGTAPVQGPFRVNERMVDKLLHRSKVRHVANLCCPVAYELAQQAGIPGYTCSFSEDSMLEIAKISGLPQIVRSAEGHMENWFAVSRKAAAQLGKPYEQCNMIVAHMGGGTTMGLHMGGKIVDVIGDTEGAFGPERSGGLPLSGYLDLVLSGSYTQQELRELMRGKGGLYAYCGTADGREVERRIADGDHLTEVVYHAMALQEAKAIAALAATARGKVECIALSGGLANSKLFTGWIREMVEFIAPVSVFPGEYEMAAMSMAILNVLNGSAVAAEYTEEVDKEN